MKALSFAICLIYLSIFNLLAGTAKGTIEESTADQKSHFNHIGSQVIEVDKPKQYDSTALHRLDFRIQGKSCAICLMGIQRRINALDGTVKVAVMLKKPYGASIIYDSKQVSEEKLLVTAKANEPLIKLLDVKDEAIEKVPLVLIPPHADIPDSNQKSDQSLLPIH